MKLASLCLFVAICSAAHIQKRASTSDKATIGYATLNGGTSGGGTATPITVSTLDELKSVVQGSTAKVVLLNGVISGSEIVDIGGNTSLLGKAGAALEGMGLRVNATNNVIIRNIKISNVLSLTGDAIRTVAASRVWIDHMDLSADMDHDKDYYGGLISITQGSSGTSITNSYLHDHWNAVASGLTTSDENYQGNVTLAYNKWQGLNSGAPRARWGNYYVLCSYYVSNNGGVIVGAGSNVFVDSNVFENTSPQVTVSGGTLYARSNSGYTPPGGTPITPAVIIDNLSCSVSYVKSMKTGAIMDF
ncbi:hypothetical protein RSOLAG22IIIB_08157 [Rhizoctonia solani]|uniref:Pectate lyase domain-containing protein n=1 Tax=Rhizoctonia solani TaxID=456999 RepID=A0A0K6FRU9_9AGAM|nr:hypothetical protein RSOLAG22IIIB_08157 [Rhizoctonia solani]